MGAQVGTNPLNMNKLEIRNFLHHLLTSDPGSPAVGQSYFNTSSDLYRIYTSGGWVTMNPSVLLGQTNTWTAAQTINAAITGNNTINLSGTGSSAVGGTFAATAFSATGLTGATSGGRLVGATASGAPASGTFLKGDMVIDQTGAIWVCTTAGSPGTWGSVGGGTVYYQTIKNNAGTGQTQRANLRFNSGTFATATVTDSSPDTIVSFDVAVATPSGVLTFGGSNAQGSSSSLARADHVHALPAHDAAAHSAIKLSDLASPTSALALNSQKITGMADGTATTDAATWGQVQNLVAGLDWKQAVRVVTTTNVTISGPGATLDGVTMSSGDRFLAAGQSTASQNGIYVWNGAAVAATRASDADANGEIKVGTVVPVQAGTNANTFWYATATAAVPWVAGTSSSTWAFLFTVSSAQAGAGLTATANVLDVVGGTGIAVTANAVAVDRTGSNNAHVAQLFQTNTHASSTSIAITHNLGNKYVIAKVYDSSDNELALVDIVLTSTTVTTFNFAVAPSSNSLRFVIYG